MSLITFWNERIKRLDWKDMGLVKVSVAGFTLMIAKLWEPLISLEWYWYAVVFVGAGILPIYKAYFQK